MLKYVGIERKKKWLLLRLIGASVLSLALAVGGYLVWFWMICGYTLSSNPQDWAQFGDYLSGTLGPAFAFIAFIGVFETVRLQAEQLELSRRQAKIDEVQRLLASIASRLDQFLDQLVHSNFSVSQLREKPATFFNVLSAGGCASLRASDDWMVEAFRSKLIEEAKRALEMSASHVGLELDQLAWCLGVYRLDGGAEDVIRFYKFRYSVIAHWMKALGFWSSYSFADMEFFDNAPVFSGAIK